jgi:hypothetical protein
MVYNWEHSSPEQCKFIKGGAERINKPEHLYVCKLNQEEGRGEKDET